MTEETVYVPPFAFPLLEDLEVHTSPLDLRAYFQSVFWADVTSHLVAHLEQETSAIDGLDPKTKDPLQVLYMLQGKRELTNWLLETLPHVMLSKFQAERADEMDELKEMDDDDPNYAD